MSKPTLYHSHIARIINVVSTALFCVLILLLVMRLISTTHDFSFYLIMMALMLSLFAADVISGLAHFIADNFGNTETSIMGKIFILPFREHHAHQQDIVSHSFLKLNGNSALLCLPILYLVYKSTLPLFMIYFSLFFCMGIFFTNSIHRYAHMLNPPGWVKILQNCGFILSPKAHKLHHIRPYTKNFCVTTGWFNPILNKLSFMTKDRGKIA